MRLVHKSLIISGINKRCLAPTALRQFSALTVEQCTGRLAVCLLAPRCRVSLCVEINAAQSAPLRFPPLLSEPGSSSSGPTTSRCSDPAKPEWKRLGWQGANRRISATHGRRFKQTLHYSHHITPKVKTGK